MKKILLVFLCFFNSLARGEDVNVMDFGAVADGSTVTTEAIQEAIDYCSTTGGGTVTVPPGTYLTHTIFLKNGVNLHIRKGAMILADTVPGSFTRSIIYAEHIEDAAITGLGIINGQGFSKYFPRGGPRYNNIHFSRCRNIMVKDLTMINSSLRMIEFRECDGVRAQGIKIFSYVNTETDGIMTQSKNVVISDCIVDCEDDAIVLKSFNPDYVVENVTITNCVISTNCNAIKFGTETHGGFKNIAISNCVVRWPYGAAKIPPRSTLKGCDHDSISEIGLALEIVDGGFMDQVTVSNITMTGIQTPLFIRLGNRGGRGNRHREDAVPGTLKNVVISNITATDETLLNSSITGIPGAYVENVIVKDLIFNSKGTGTMVEAEAEVPEKIDSYPQANVVFGYSTPAYGMYVRHVKNLVLDNLIFNLKAPDARPAVMLDDCHNIRVSNFDVDTPTNNQPLIRIKQSTNVTISGYRPVEAISSFLVAEGEDTRGIKLTGNDFSRVKEVVKFRDDCKESAVKRLNNFE